MDGIGLDEDLFVHPLVKTSMGSFHTSYVELGKHLS